ncbi:MAG TPA: hypothetical protein VGI10_27400 [Polyangiaceae bacterium]|jgi:hypothetical protein
MRQVRVGVRTVSWVFALGLSCQIARAANEEERAGARAAASQGEQAFKEKRWADAVDLFSRAESLVHSPVHLLFKARALAALGQLVKAHEILVAVSREVPPAGAPALFVSARKSAEGEAAELEPRIASITIKLDGVNVANATVTMDGSPVPPALVGVARPVDPGEHKFQATSPDAQSDVVTLTVGEGRSASGTLLLKALPAGANTGSDPTLVSAAAEPGTTAPATPASAATGPADATNAGRRPVPTGVYVGIAATGALALGGGVVGLLAASKHSDFTAHNDGSDPAHATDLKDSGKTLNLATDLLFGGALVAGAITAVLYLSRPEAAAHPVGLSLTPSAGPQSAALSLTGRF